MHIYSSANKVRATQKIFWYILLHMPSDDCTHMQVKLLSTNLVMGGGNEVPLGV